MSPVMCGGVRVHVKGVGRMGAWPGSAKIAASTMGPRPSWTRRLDRGQEVRVGVCVCSGLQEVRRAWVEQAFCHACYPEPPSLLSGLSNRSAVLAAIKYPGHPNLCATYATKLMQRLLTPQEQTS